MRNLLAYVALTYCSGTLLFLWIQIWIYGYGGFYENNLAIRAFETVLWALVVLLGLERSIAWLRQFWRGGET